MRTHHFHPWRRMRDLGPSWRLAWSDALPWDVYGFTDFGRRTITLRSGMSFEERRCTITHEVEHVLRGPSSRCSRLSEELLVDRWGSRLLLCSIRDIADAMAWHHADYEQVAEELWVDPWTLEVRMSNMTQLERGYLDRRLRDVDLEPHG